MLERVSAELDGRQLVWFGTRGDDIEGLGDLPELAAAFSIVSAYEKRPSIETLALEQLTGERVDLDVYELDEDDRHPEALAELRRRLWHALHRPSVVVTYRPSAFIASVTFPRRDRCRYLGLFKDHQRAFDFKPWVETAVEEMGIPIVPWRYVVDADQLLSIPFLESGPLIVRPSRTTGGVGFSRLEEAEALAALLDELVSPVAVAPFIEDGVPVNVGAVVWRDGVTLHPASVQLIGIPCLTQRPFGYCGNDFGAVAWLDSAKFAAMEDAVTRIGRWMGARGYRGAFGVDFLVTEEGPPLFTEVNPRFQGSTHASCQISVERGESCLMLEHLAALLGMRAPSTVSLMDQCPRGGGGGGGGGGLHTSSPTRPCQSGQASIPPRSRAGRSKQLATNAVSTSSPDPISLPCPAQPWRASPFGSELRQPASICSIPGGGSSSAGRGRSRSPHRTRRLRSGTRRRP